MGAFGVIAAIWETVRKSLQVTYRLDDPIDPLNLSALVFRRFLSVEQYFYPDYPAFFFGKIQVLLCTDRCSIIPRYLFVVVY